jgi:hypothetical protein
MKQRMKDAARERKKIWRTGYGEPRRAEDG